MAVALGFSACQKQANAPVEKPGSSGLVVEVVKETERSRNFVAVNRQLELGGTLYGYIDVDGDIDKMTGGLQALIGEMAKTQPNIAPFAQANYVELARILGLTDIKAVGVSSVPDGTGYFRNRMFLHTGAERHGLMAGLGGKPGPFTHLNLAPADTTAYGETEVDLAVVYKSLKEAVAKVAGEPTGNQLEAALKKSGESIALSLVDLIYGLKGRAAMVLRVDSTRTMRFPGPTPLVLPTFSLLVCIDGIAPIVETALARSPVFRRRDDGPRHIYELAGQLPIPDLQPVLVAEGPTLYLATTIGFFTECRDVKSGLAQTEEFKQALAHVGTEGNGLGFVSPRLFEHFRQVEKLNPNVPAQSKSMLAFIMSRLPKPDRPLVGVRVNTEDGILIRSYLNRSLKQDVAGVAVYNPVTIGLLAAMAVPAFQKVRVASQEKAVLNNLRQLAAAADQFYLENGVKAATYNDLVGAGRLIRVLNPVAGENYRQVRFLQGQPLRVVLPDGRVVQYPPAGRGR